VAQAVALERLLAQRVLNLEAVVELRVDEGILINRIETRVGQMKARGEAVRADDDPEVLKQRLAAYRSQTAPLVDHYREKGLLRTVDGMPPIDQVSEAIGRVLAGGQKRAAARKPAGSPRKASKARSGKARGGRRKQAKAAKRKAGRRPRRAARKPARRRAKSRRSRR
jgi:adenylate kinase